MRGGQCRFKIKVKLQAGHLKDVREHQLGLKARGFHFAFGEEFRTQFEYFEDRGHKVKTTAGGELPRINQKVSPREMVISGELLLGEPVSIKRTR